MKTPNQEESYNKEFFEEPNRGDVSILATDNQPTITLTSDISSSSVMILNQFIQEENTLDSCQAKNDYTQADNISNLLVIKKLLKTTLPLCIISWIGVGNNFAKLSIISKLNTDLLAAKSLYENTLNVLSSLNSGLLSVPISVLVSENFGKKDYSKVGNIVKQSWIVAATLGITSNLALFFFIKPILIAFNQEKKTVLIVESYSKVASFSCPAIFTMVVDIAFLNSVSKNKILIPLFISSALIGISSTYILVMKKIDLLGDLGINGFGYATLIEVWINWIILKLYFTKAEFRQYNLFDFYSVNCNDFREIFRLGIPTALLSLGATSQSFLIETMIGRLGAKQLDLDQTINSYMGFFEPFALSISMSSQILVAQFKGSQEHAKIRYFGNIGILCTAAISVLPLCIFVIFPNQLARNFIPEDDIKRLGIIVKFSFISQAISIFLSSIQNCLCSNLNGLLDTFVPSIIQLLFSFILVLPLTYLVTFKFGWDLVGINVAGFIGTGMIIIPLLWRWHKLSKIEVTEERTITEISSETPNETPEQYVCEQQSDARQKSLCSANDDKLNILLSSIKQKIVPEKQVVKSDFKAKEALHPDKEEKAEKLDGNENVSTSITTLFEAKKEKTVKSILHSPQEREEGNDLPKSLALTSKFERITISAFPS